MSTDTPKTITATPISVPVTITKSTNATINSTVLSTESTDSTSTEPSIRSSSTLKGPNDPGSEDWVLPVCVSVGLLLLVVIITVVVVTILVRRRKKNKVIKQPKELPKLNSYGLPEGEEPQSLRPRPACPGNEDLTSINGNDGARNLNHTSTDADRDTTSHTGKGGSKKQKRKAGEEQKEKKKKEKAESNNIYANIPDKDTSSKLNYRPSVSSIPSSPAPNVPSAFQVSGSAGEPTPCEGTFDAMYIPMDLCNPSTPKLEKSPLQVGSEGEFESVYTYPENPLDKLPAPPRCGGSTKPAYVNLPGEHQPLQPQSSGNPYQNCAFDANHDYGNVQAGANQSGHAPSFSAKHDKAPVAKPKTGSSNSSSQPSTPKSSKSDRSPLVSQPKPSPKPSPKPVLTTAQQLHIATKAKASLQDMRQQSSEHDYENTPDKKVEPKAQKQQRR